MAGAAAVTVCPDADVRLSKSAPHRRHMRRPTPIGDCCLYGAGRTADAADCHRRDGARCIRSAMKAEAISIRTLQIGNSQFIKAVRLFFYFDDFDKTKPVTSPCSPKFRETWKSFILLCISQRDLSSSLSIL